MLMKLNAHCFMLKELKSVLPSLESLVDKSPKNGIIYKIIYPRSLSAKRVDIWLLDRQRHWFKFTQNLVAILFLWTMSIFTTCTKSIVKLMTLH